MSKITLTQEQIEKAQILAYKYASKLHCRECKRNLLCKASNPDSRKECIQQGHLKFKPYPARLYKTNKFIDEFIEILTDEDVHC